MRRGVRAARVALFVMVGLMVGAGVAAAQVDVAKVLVGTWKGELQQRTQKDADPTLVLIISSVKQEAGKWVAGARVGATEEKTRSVNLEIDTTGAKPSVRWTAGSGTIYNLTLLDDKNLVGTGTLTTGKGGGRGDRDRPVTLEKKE
jgi:hypothetical protein